jgi:hypothetical protein
MMVVSVIAAGLAVTGCSSVSSSGRAVPGGSPRSSSVSSAASATALQPAGPWATAWTYTLSDLSSCHVTDALTVIKNRLPDPVRLTSVHLSAVGDSPGSERVSTEVTAYKANTTTGAAGAISPFPPLLHQRLVPAIGATLAPVASSGTWYEVVLDIDVVGAHPRQWSINGISVGFTVGNKTHVENFPQLLKLAPVGTCPVN